MRLLQVCNVGSITGGTAACAWTVTRALPDWDHTAAFLGNVSEETRAVFGTIPTPSIPRVTQSLAAPFDAVVLHNTNPARCEQLSTPTVSYRHSQKRVVAGDVTVACSRWLARKTGDREVMWQGVNRVATPTSDGRALRDEIVIGRLCTPRVAKWPPASVELTRAIAQRCEHVHWELVGCPHELQPAFETATRGRVTFLPASWSARQRLAEWDVLLYSNRDVTESFGRVVAEAMRVGCVPIVDHAGGFVEQLEDGGGVLCKTTDDFVTAVTELQDPFARRTVSRRAMEISDERFSIGVFRRRLLGVLARACDR